MLPNRHILVLHKVYGFSFSFVSAGVLCRHHEGTLFLHAGKSLLTHRSFLRREHPCFQPCEACVHILSVPRDICVGGACRFREGGNPDRRGEENMMVNNAKYRVCPGAVCAVLC